MSTIVIIALFVVVLLAAGCAVSGGKYKDVDKHHDTFAGGGK